jgi:hypothetical protein
MGLAAMTSNANGSIRAIVNGAGEKWELVGARGVTRPRLGIPPWHKVPKDCPPPRGCGDLPKECMDRVVLYRDTPVAWDACRAQFLECLEECASRYPPAPCYRGCFDIRNLPACLGIWSPICEVCNCNDEDVLGAVLICLGAAPLGLPVWRPE